MYLFVNRLKNWKITNTIQDFYLHSEVLYNGFGSGRAVRYTVLQNTDPSQPITAKNLSPAKVSLFAENCLHLYSFNQWIILNYYKPFWRYGRLPVFLGSNISMVGF